MNALREQLAQVRQKPPTQGAALEALAASSKTNELEKLARRALAVGNSLALVCHPGLAELPQVQASQRAYWGTAGRGSAHIEGRTSRDALDHLNWINDLDDNEERRGIFKINNNSITKNESHLANYMLPHKSDFSKKTTVIYGLKQYFRQRSGHKRARVCSSRAGSCPGAFQGQPVGAATPPR